MSSKQCTKCLCIMSLDAFRVDARYTGGYGNQCKTCMAAYSRERRARSNQAVDTAEPKMCVGCHRMKMPGEFHRDKSSSNGLKSWCKDCNREYQRAWAAEQRATNEGFVEKQRNRNRIHMRQAHRANPGKFRERARQRYQEKEKARRAAPDYRARLSDQIRARRRADPAFRLRLLQANIKRRAQKRNQTFHGFSYEEWRGLLDWYHNCCAYCGLEFEKLEQDHVMPLSRGGLHDISNIVPACRSCNGSKNDRTPDEAGMILLTPQEIERRYQVERRKVNR